MYEILQLYVSGFWVWLGITIGLSVVVKGIYILVIGMKGMVVSFTKISNHKENFKNGKD